MITLFLHDNPRHSCTVAPIFKDTYDAAESYTVEYMQLENSSSFKSVKVNMFLINYYDKPIHS